MLLSSVTREKRLEEEKQLDYSLKAAKRFDVLALAISKEKSATRRLMERFQDQVERKVMNFVNKTNQSIVGIDKKGTEVKETVQQYSYNISSLEQTLNNIQKTVSDLYGGFGEIKDAISKIENELIKLKKLMKMSSAVLQCQELGGELAEADTVAEMNYLLGFTDSSAWIGASNRDEEGKFVWRSSNMPLWYLPWKHIQPNNWGGNQDCLIIWDSNDEPCQNSYSFICEK
ncbi:low affinity immunoglobulin epsilon Fc receptor-like [Mercenaria mercenaria]|uniref:low affinity immunoglobulin epsilon Fc receptor-like n=1 Tax=Mercenaria mercenaria TaxID=6596 RepID=UPI00234ECA2E|nr:low affinity immunoglobulin epsilon Fc receptor-like [Mercenaria mercenaria]